MATYCISDIHGCYDQFMELIGQIEFEPNNDTLFVLGDAIDRGDQPLECLLYIMRTKSVHLILGNHEQMMLDFYGDKYEGRDWLHNGCAPTMNQFLDLPEPERDRILAYLHKRPLYKTLAVCGRRYFLSHSGLDASLPFCRQNSYSLVWSREEFYMFRALPSHTVIFGHTPTTYLRFDLMLADAAEDCNDCSIWLDDRFMDKICIDSGCVFGGALAALRLDDGKVFYVSSARDGSALGCYTNATSVPESFYSRVGVPRKNEAIR